MGSLSLCRVAVLLDYHTLIVGQQAVAGRKTVMNTGHIHFIGMSLLSCEK